MSRHAQLESFFNDYATRFTRAILGEDVVDEAAAAFADCFIGEDDDMVIDLSKEATYKDAEGNMVSAFQRDQTLIRVIAKHDFGPRHVESVAVLTGVTWGKTL